MKRGLYNTSIGAWRRYDSKLIYLKSQLLRLLPVLKAKNLVPHTDTMNWELDVNFRYNNDDDESLTYNKDDSIGGIEQNKKNRKLGSRRKNKKNSIKGSRKKEPMQGKNHKKKRNNASARRKRRVR